MTRTLMIGIKIQHCGACHDCLEAVKKMLGSLPGTSVKWYDEGLKRMKLQVAETISDQFILSQLAQLGYGEAFVIPP